MKGSLLTESSVDGGGGGAVDGGDGKAVLGGVGKDLADVVTGNDTSGDDIEETHCDLKLLEEVESASGG